jgi:S1-C subfamily serine protease
VANGARISCLVNGAPGARAGLKQGDVITKFGHKTIASADDLTAAVTKAKPGEKVTVTVTQSGSTKQISVTLGTQPSSVSNNCSQ